MPAVHQGYIEPHACLVSIEPSGKINVWLSNKMPFLARSQFAAALGVPEDRVRVNPVSIGGDFGGKGSLMDSILCYYLAQQSGRPGKDGDELYRGTDGWQSAARGGDHHAERRDA